MSLDKLTVAVGTAFAADCVRAGVVVSNLGNSDWYVSVARYPHGLDSKKIVCSAKARTYEGAVTACMLAWLVFAGRTRQLAKELETNLGAACRRAL